MNPASSPLSKDVLRKAKARLLRMHFESGVGHIGGNLSAMDLIMHLHHKVLSRDDAFILSKGHAAGALYVTLWSMGRLSEEDLRQFHQDATKMPGHPPPHLIPEIRFATGSLGHGLSLSAGMALGKRLRGEPGKIYCLLSDGEWDEGSNWEALIFIAHHKLDNLVLIVDVNGLQGFGATKEIADLDPLAEKFRSFHLSVKEIAGHDPKALASAFSGTTPGPQVIIANTKKGHGVSFMENRMEWHYLPMTEPQYRQALAEIQSS